MKVEYQLNKQDYVDFNLFHSKHSKTLKRAYFIRRYITSLLYLIMPLILIFITDISYWVWLLLSLLTYVSWVVFYPSYYKIKLKKDISKSIKQNKGMLNKKSIWIDNRGIFTSVGTSEIKTEWKKVESIEETDTHIFIYISPTNAYIIPTREFKDSSEKKEFINTLKAKTKKRKKQS